MSDEGPLVTSMVGSQMGLSWGTVVAGWPKEATINGKWLSLVRRRTVTVPPRATLVATLEELFKLEPLRGVSQRSSEWKHLWNWGASIKTHEQELYCTHVYTSCHR